jgi:phosphatidylserine/phosphatidylglycerophosphate/cardiolipin synthase-like enzyme
MTGWQMLSDSIRQSQATKYFLAGSNFFLTQPEVLSCWLKLCKPDKVYAALHRGKGSTFHPKVLIVEGKSSFAIVGSGNLSRGGLKDNVECGLYTDDEFIVSELRRWFDDLFADSPPLTESAVLDYKKKWKRLRVMTAKLREEQEAIEKEFDDKREATLRQWTNAVASAKAYLSSKR